MGFRLCLRILFLQLLALGSFRAQEARSAPSIYLQLQEGEGRENAVRRAPPQGEAVGLDGWSYGSAEGRNSLFFWEFKYFNFHAAEASGNVAFFTVAPRWTRQMVVLARVYAADKILLYRKTYDLKCVRASRSDAGLDLCGEGGIEVLSPGLYRIALRAEPARWDLEIRAPEVSGRAVRAHLDGWLPWEMFWNPVFLRAAVNGTIELQEGSSSRTISLREAPAYHDCNWGRWAPPAHPYRWLHFSGLDSLGDPVDVLLGDFHKNKADASSLLVRTRQGRRVYRRDEFEFVLQGAGRAKTSRFGIKPGEVTQSSRPRDYAFKEGDHDIPTRFSISAKDGSFHLTAETLLNDGSGPTPPVFLRPLFGDFVIDEQLVRVKAEFQFSSGERRRAEGMGEFQNVDGF